MDYFRPIFGMGNFEKLFEEEVLMRTLPATLLHIFFQDLLNIALYFLKYPANVCKEKAKIGQK